jgi:hypothetical protein
MATNNDKILAGYPQSIGGKIEVIVDHYGPLSYSQTTADVYQASQLGQGGFDIVQAGTSYNPGTGVAGNYTVQVYYSTGYAGIGSPSVKLVWYINGSTQVTNGTNLNGEVVRLKVIGY